MVENTKKRQGLYSGLRYLETKFGVSIDLETESQKFEDLVDMTKQKETFKTIIEPKSNKKPTPPEFSNKTWDELYRMEKLPEIQKSFPELYSKLRKEKFNF